MEQEASTAGAIEQIEIILRRRLLGRVHDLHVVLIEQTLVLRGWAHTYYAKQLAQQAAAEFSGLRILVNEIEVRPYP